MTPAEFLEWLVGKRSSVMESEVVDDLVRMFIEEGQLTKGYERYEGPEK